MSTTQFPSTKAKFDPNAAYEEVPETVVPKKKVAFNPSAKFEVVAEPPKVIQPETELQKSQNLLQNTYDQHADKTIYNMLEDKYIKGETDRLIKNQSLGVRGEPFRMRFPDEVKPLVQATKEEINQNPDLARPVIKRIIKDNPDQSKAIKKAMYVTDASKRDHSAAVVEHNANQIGAGDLDYDIDNKQVVKPEGFVDQIFRKISEHSQSMDNYDFFTSHNKRDILNKLEADSKNKNPDTPAFGSSGIMGDIGGMIGSNVVPMAKTELPRLLAPIPGVGEAAVGAGMLWGASDFHHIAYENTLRQVYGELRQKKVPEEEALDQATKEAEFSGNLAAAQGLVLTAAGSRIGKSAEFKPVNYKSTFTKALTDIGNNSSEVIKSMVPDMAVQPAIAAGVKAIENAHQGKPIGEGVGQAAIGAALFVAGIGVLRAPKGLLTGKAYENLVQGYSQAPSEVVDRALNTNVQHGNLTEDQAVSIKNELNNHKAANENKVDVHTPITPEAEQVLRDVEDNGVPKVMTKTLEKIAKDNGIEPEKPAEGKEPKELKPQEVIDELKKKQATVKLPDTFEKQPEPAPREHEMNGEKHVSVIKPEENKAPNIVNLKSQENAIQERSPEAVPMDESPGHSEAVGARISESGETSNAQQPEAIQNKNKEEVARLEVERNGKIQEVGKPNVKLDFVSPEELVKSKDPRANKEIHNGIKNKFKDLKEAINCLWLA